MTEQPVFIGLDATAGPRPMTLAILDPRLCVLRCESLPMEDALRVIEEYPRAVCGVDAPLDVSRSLLADPATRQRMGLNPKQKGYATHRICEYELRRRGINSYKTPVSRERAPGWMQQSWRLYDRLRDLGFVAYPGSGPRVMFETYPHAAYSVLVKRRPYPKNSLEGRLQRQLVLYQEGVEVPDAMDIFEEWTRHRFLVGELPMKGIYNHDELDALIAAYTAFVLHREPHNTTALGDAAEGQIIVPASLQELRETY